MPSRGKHALLDLESPPAGDHASDGSAGGWVSHKTLPFRVEVRRQLSRRRTQLSLGFLVLLPFLLALAFGIGGDPGQGAPGLVDLATRGAGNFTLFTLFVAVGFLLVVVVSLFCGDTVASEASWSSLRYLLASPVPRGRLLRAKLFVALAYSLFAVVLLPLVAYAVGATFFGSAPIQNTAGTTFSTGEGLWRLLLIVGYIAVTLLFVASLAFLLGVYTDAPLGAVGGAVLLVILSNILDAVTALGSLRHGLPTHYSFAWTDALAPQVVGAQMTRGVLWSLGYSTVLLAVAFWHFGRKDIVS